ncbi:hypothetical protein DWZ43_07395 [Ruminococcus sp. AF32-2AC]|jgi:hypothetical protein|nr:hypothetical protein DWZ43_07395 [Ruminococcus sp. AF32-2AC]RGH42479.1 hypothetical protein DW898_10945 [Ruminococcus sp. AM41-2AC]
MEFRMKIADVLMDVSSQYEMLAEYCRDYMVEDSAEEVSERLVLTMEDIEKERTIAEKSGEPVSTLGSQQNMPQYSPQYLETLAALRKIADFMPEKDCFLMHGAVVAWKNQGYLFTAPSGTGKSTHLALWKKYLGDQAEVINGDKPILKVTEDEVWVYGTPWAGKEQWQVNKKVALKGICFLERGEKNSIQKIDSFSALPFLMRQVYFTDAPQSAGKTMELLDQMLKIVPLYKMKCDISKEAFECSFGAMTFGKWKLQ